LGQHKNTTPLILKSAVSMKLVVFAASNSNHSINKQLVTHAAGLLSGIGVLETATNSAPHFGADLRGSLSIPRFNDNFDTTSGQLTNAELQAKLEATVATLLG